MLILVLTSASPSWTQEMPVPVAVQWNLFSKVLLFDGDLSARANDELVVGVAFQQRFRKSLTAKNAVIKAASSVKRMGRFSYRCLEIDISDSSDLASTIEANGIDILYVTPLRAMEVETISSATRATRTITLTGVPEYVVSGLGIGIGMEGEKPQIIINHRAAKAEGCHLSSLLLRLARVVN